MRVGESWKNSFGETVTVSANGLTVTNAKGESALAPKRVPTTPATTMTNATKVTPEERAIELRMEVHVAEAALRHAMARGSLAERTKANDALAAVQKELAGVEEQLQRDRLRQQGVNVAANGELPLMAVMPYTQSTNAPQRPNAARKSAPQDEAAFMPVMPYTKSQGK